MPLNTVTLGDLPCHDPTSASDVGSYNFFQSYAGAADPGFGKLLMTRKDFADLPTSSTSKLVFTSGNTDKEQKTQRLEVEVYPAVAYTVSPSISGADQDMVCVVVYDKRLANRAVKDAQYNVQLDGFPLGNTDKPIFLDGSLNSHAEWTWAQVFTDLGVTNQTKADLPTWKPRNLSFIATGKGKAIDEAARKIIHIVGVNPSDYHPTLLKAGAATDANTKLRKAADNFLIFGSDTSRSVGRLPANAVVDFFINDPRLNGTQISGPGVAAHQETVSLASAGEAGPDTTILVLDYVAHQDNGTLKNGTELTAVATDIAQRWFAEMKLPAKEETFAGIWPFYPDGEYRAILWQSTAKGATTRVKRNITQPFLTRNDQGGGQRISGLGQQVRAGTDYAGVSKVWAATGAIRFGKVKTYTAGSNQVTLTPCDTAGTVPSPAPADITIYITLPTTRTTCSFFSAAVDDVLAYHSQDGVFFLASVPMPSSTTRYDVYQITAVAGTGGFDSVRVK